MSSEATSEGGVAATQPEFVAREFETTVTDSDRERIVEAVATAVSNLRDQTDDDTLGRLLRGESGHKVLKTADTHDYLKPEPFTQQAVLDVLFEELGYENLLQEVADTPNGTRKIADYSMPFDIEDETNRLLIEAEPLGKSLDSRNHGVGQVRDWLSRREFQSDFGFATNGLQWVFVRYDGIKYESHRIESIDLRPVFITVFEAVVGDGSLPDDFTDDEGDENNAIDRLVRTFDRENFLSIARDARQVIADTQEAITEDFYDDYVRYVFGITEGDDRTTRSLIGEGIVAPDEATGDDVRLFAVGLMNRLLFVKFLEDKGIVRSDLLRTLKETHENVDIPGSLHDTFLEPLFYGVFDTRPAKRTARIQSIDLFAEAPYLNGGLFRPLVGEDEPFDESDFDVRDTVLVDIIDLLEDYEFSAGGGVTDLDPSVLGNVFEKTIIYLTTASGDKNKELGAYYTPDEITHFCAKRTVQPCLLDRFKDVLREREWPESEIEQYSDLLVLIDDLPGNKALIDALLAEVDSFRALDPAVGSGHFLTSVLGEIVNVRKSLHATRGDDPDEWVLRKETVTKNIYGVDILEPAVEIAKLRLWLNIIAEVDADAIETYDEDDLALPNVVFNVRQGNSLIGFTDLVETKGETDGEGESQQAALSSWGPDSVREKYGNIITQVTKHKRASDRTEAIDHLREAEALLERYREELDPKVLDEFHEAGIEDATVEQVREYQPFHWVLEFAKAYADGGFDVVVGNPPWDQLRPSRDDYFSRFDKRFRARMPAEKDAKQAELLEDDEIATGWEKYNKNIEVQMTYFTDGSTYELQKPTINGRIDPNENNTSALFLERVFNLVRGDGYVAQVLPGSIFNGSFSKNLRLKMLDESCIDALVAFENKGIFDEIDDRFNFAVVAFENNGTTETLRGIFQQRDVRILQDLEQRAVEIPRGVLTEYSPEARIFPFVSDQREVNGLRKIQSHPPLGEKITGVWKAVPRRELDRARAADRFVESEDEGDYPVYGGRNIYQFQHDDSVSDKTESPTLWSIEEGANPQKSAKYRVRERMFNSGDLKRAIFDACGGSETNDSQKRFVNDLLNEHGRSELSTRDVLPGFSEYRIVFRDIARASDERTMIATVLPKGIPCVHTLQTLPPYRISLDDVVLSDDPLHSAYERAYSDEELFVLVGLLNSVPFDSLMRTKVDTHIVKYKFTESQLPRLTEGDDWFEYIWTRAARLNCYGEAFAEMRERLGGIDPATEKAERRQLQAEIDAAAFHAYGLDREETTFVLDDFHRVKNPRVMTEAYFDSVLEYYDALAERGPFP